MSGPIPGHGYRDWRVITPRCKCGWTGSPVKGSEPIASQLAREAFERHKASVRHENGGYSEVKHRRLQLVKGSA